MIDAKTFEKAIIFAAKCHEGQVRKGDGRPYILHPISVMTRILSIKKSSNPYLLGTAAILHDVAEDCLEHMSTEDKLNMIAKDFGFHVAALVKELTLDKSQYEKMGKKEYLAQEMLSMSSYALAIKLCDRLDNVSDLQSMPPDFVAKYVAETEYILMKLRTRTLTKTQTKLVGLIKAELSKVTKEYSSGIRYTRPPRGGRRPLGGGPKEILA